MDRLAKKKKLGFTLIELLATIIILGVLMLIAIPSVTGYISASRKKAYISTASQYADGLSQKINSLEYAFNNTAIAYYVPVNCINLEKGGKSPYGNWEYAYIVTIFDGKKHNYYWTSKDTAGYGIQLENIDKLTEDSVNANFNLPEPISGDQIEINGNNYTVGVSTTTECGNIPDSVLTIAYKEDNLNGADPILDDGMIPIYFDGNIPKKANIRNEWYNYTNKKWANTILVKENVRSQYKQMAVGTEIVRSDILAYFVWIPRYRYQLFNVAGKSGTTPKSISIIFENKDTIKSTGTQDKEWLTAPGFTFNNTELNGMWVGKFETTGDATEPTILPNVSSLRSQNLSAQFETSQKFTSPTYGLNAESRIMRNDEWSAIAYLTNSVYGTDKEVRINNSNSMTTGCGANSDNAASSSNCDIRYEGSSNYPQSTTGNITGIFDMSGGSWEYVMGVIADEDGNPIVGRDSTSNSGYNGSLSSGKKTDGKELPDNKYYKLYKDNSPNTACNNDKCLGDTLIETNGWYGDYYSFINDYDPWIVRGGGYNHNTQSGLYTVLGLGGYAVADVSFRTVVTITR